MSPFSKDTPFLGNPTQTGFLHSGSVADPVPLSRRQGRTTRVKDPPDSDPHKETRDPCPEEIRVETRPRSSRLPSGIHRDIGSYQWVRDVGFRIVPLSGCRHTSPDTLPFLPPGPCPGFRWTLFLSLPKDLLHLTLVF